MIIIHNLMGVLKLVGLDRLLILDRGTAHVIHDHF